MMEPPSHTIFSSSGSSLLLSHSWLNVLMAQRARNSFAMTNSSLSSSWTAAASSLLRGNALVVRQGILATGPSLPAAAASSSSLRYHPRRPSGDSRRGRRNTLRYYSRNEGTSNNDNGGAAKSPQRQDRSSEEDAPKGSDGTDKPPVARSDVRSPPQKPTPMTPRDDHRDRRVQQRQWKEYQEHERMSQVLSKDRDDSISRSTSVDYDFEEEKKEEDSSSSDYDDAAAAIPIVIRVPYAEKEEDADGSVVSDLSVGDFEDEDDDDRDDGPPHVLDEASAAEARTESPGRRMRPCRKVKISVTGAGQVPPMKPWIVPMGVPVEDQRHDPTWDMTTADIHDQLCQDDWPSDEDDNDNNKKNEPRVPRVRLVAGAAAPILESSPATTISLSSSSSSSSVYGRRCDHRVLIPPVSARTLSECASPEFQPSRLFRDFRKQHPRPLKHKPHGAAAHGRNSHVLVGGEAVLVQVERRQDKSSSASSFSPLRAGAGPAAASQPHVGTSTVSCT
jgi:hypothetical protein